MRAGRSTGTSASPLLQLLLNPTLLSFRGVETL
jgi:hypothetical protein